MGKRIHDIDGKQMTVKEIAEMLGVTVHAVQARRFEMGQCSYQVVVDMYRQNMFQTKEDRWQRHLVDGKYITVADAAKMVGYKEKSIRSWRWENKTDGKLPTLQEAVDHFRKYRTGEVKRYKGSVAARHRVHGKLMTVEQAAKKYGTTKAALYSSMGHYGRSLDAAVRRIERLNEDRAAKEIMAILGGK